MMKSSTLSVTLLTLVMAFNLFNSDKCQAQSEKSNPRYQKVLNLIEKLRQIDQSVDDKLSHVNETRKANKETADAFQSELLSTNLDDKNSRRHLVERIEKRIRIGLIWEEDLLHSRLSPIGKVVWTPVLDEDQMKKVEINYHKIIDPIDHEIETP